MRSRALITYFVLLCAAVAPLGSGCEELSQSNDAPERDVNGFTELHRAARASDIEAVHELLRFGADPNVTDFGGVTPLHRAARDRNYDLVTELVRYGAKLDLKTATGWTALHLAIRAGDKEMVELLLGYGASLDVRLPDGSTPLSYAVTRDKPGIVDSILLRANIADATGTTLDINAKDSNGDTALHLAAKNTNTDMAISLMAVGADPTIPNKANETPFFVAVREKAPMLVGAMLESGASVLEKTPTGESILVFAQQLGDEDINSMLAQYAPVNREL